jgi:transcriptional regulator with XRE-family HTH domain
MVVLLQALRNLRKEKGVSQRAVADYLGITNQAYSNYETGRSDPDTETLSLLADYFDVTTDYLLGRVDKPGEEVGDEDDIKVALFGGAGEVTDAMWEEVKRFSEFVRLREKEKNGES